MCVCVFPCCNSTIRMFDVILVSLKSTGHLTIMLCGLCSDVCIIIIISQRAIKQDLVSKQIKLSCIRRQFLRLLFNNVMCSLYNN